MPRWAAWMRAPSAVPGIGSVARRAIGLLSEFLPGLSPKAAGMLEYGGSYAGAYLLRRGLFMPWELPGLLGEELAAEGL